MHYMQSCYILFFAIALLSPFMPAVSKWIQKQKSENISITKAMLAVYYQATPDLREISDARMKIEEALDTAAYDSFPRVI